MFLPTPFKAFSKSCRGENFKVTVDAKCNGLERCWGFFLEEEKKVSKSGGGGKGSVSFQAFENVCKKKGVIQGCKGLDLKTVFLFLDESTGKHASGSLTVKEWSLLRAFDARAVTGAPARLRKILKEKYGTLDNAFEAIYRAWLPHDLRARLDMLALARVMHVLGHNEFESQLKSIPGRKQTLVGRQSGIMDLRVSQFSSRRSVQGHRKSVQQTYSPSNKEGTGSDPFVGRPILEGWTPMLRREGPGPVAAWSLQRSWKLPGVISKPTTWPKDDGGRRAQTPRAGTVSAIDWNLRS